MKTKLCARCSKTYPLTTDYFYVARKLDRNKMGWQSHCKPCWKQINLENKTRRREIRKSKRIIDDYFRPVGV